MESLTDLVKVHKKLQDKGFVVLALHRDPTNTETKSQVLQVALSHGWTHSVYFQADLGNYALKNPPQVFIFNHEGRKVYDPVLGIDYMRDAQDYTLKAPGFILGGHTFEALSSEADKVGAMRGFRSIYPEIKEKAETGSGKEQEEAKVLLARLDGYAGFLKKRFETKLAGGYPSDALDALEELAKLYAGLPPGDEAKDLVKQTKSDKSYRNEKSAERQAGSIEKALAKIDPEGRSEDPENWKRTNARSILTVQKGLENLKKRYADTAVCKRIEAMIQLMGLE